MSMYQLSHAVERRVASFARAMTGRAAHAARPGDTAEGSVSQEELYQMTALYEESLCVWEHEMGLLQARLARDGELAGEVTRLRAVSDAALCRARRQDEEITRLFARVEGLQRENEQLGREARLLGGQLRAAVRARSADSRRGILARVIHHITRWTSLSRHSRER